MGSMTNEQKRILHEMLYHAARYRGHSKLAAYLAAKNQANWILEAIGEKLDDD